MTDTILSQTYVTLQEIIGQPEAWQDALDEIGRKTGTIQTYLAERRPDSLLFTGCGSPYFMARTLAMMAREITQLPAEAHPGSDVWLFPEQTLRAGGKPLAVVVSRSGETTEVMNAIDRFTEVTGGDVIAITCYPESTLARKVPMTLITRGGQEVGLAQTRSFTSMLVTAQALITLLAGQSLSARFLGLPDACHQIIDQYQPLAQHLGAEGGFERFFFLGGGAYYGMACEAMLKMKEMSLSQSEAYHFLEFRHGPMAMVNDKSLVIGFVSEDAQRHELAVLTEMRRMGAKVLAITPSPLTSDQADHQVILPSGFSDLERTPLYLPILHLMSYHHTVQKGLNPDTPSNLAAVVSLNSDSMNKAVS